MYRLKIIFFSFLLSLSSIHAQKVSNVSNRQEQSTIIVSFDLETKTPCKIALYVSKNGGTTWQGPLKKVTGDIGAKVSSGNKSITWSVLEEFEELSGNNIVFQVRAVINTIETIQTVKIGTQEWTKKNLDVSIYRNGDAIPEVKDPEEWSKLKTGAWCYYNNDPKTGKIYGKLYNWYAVNDPRGLAPEGYHVPSIGEWYTLINYLGGEVASGKMKEKGFTHSKSPNTPTNSSGFTGLPAGYRNGNGYGQSYGEFYDIGSCSYWWSSSKWESSFISKEANALSLNDYHNYVYYSVIEFEQGVSVRCIRD